MVDKWSDEQHAPVLSKRQLLAIAPELELNPALFDGHECGINFNFVTGNLGRYDNQTGQESDFEERLQPATMPRVAELIIITKYSPWCTVVVNPEGVSVDDIFGALYRDYEEFITPQEYGITPRSQEQMGRTRQLNEMQLMAPSMTPPGQYRRYDFLRNMIFFHRLEKDDAYARERLHYTAPNIFVMRLLS